MTSIINLIDDILVDHSKYIEYERDITQKEKDIATLKIKTAELNAYREIAQKYFNHQMAERERLFQSAHKVLDKAMQNGDIEYAQIAIQTIKVINSKSPFSY